MGEEVDLVLAFAQSDEEISFVDRNVFFFTYKVMNKKIRLTKDIINGIKSWERIGFEANEVKVPYIQSVKCINDYFWTFDHKSNLFQNYFDYYLNW